ncbi:MAG: zinc ribbon domain-containing protein [Ruminococcaceae bacterium]|nr:zinc ribbon domain-containing protein [Oscillospiraceae bacterium]
MFCPKCGKQNQDTSAFCVACGQKLIAPEQPVQQPPVQQPVYQQPPVQQPAYQQPPVQQFQPQYAPVERPFSSNPVLNGLKKFAASPLVLVAVILFTLSTVITLATTSDTVMELFYLLDEEIGIPGLDDVVDILEDSITFMTFIIMLPTIAIGIGLWITVGTALNKNSDTMVTGGLTTIKVVNIISIVFTSISIAVLVFWTMGLSSDYQLPITFYVIMFTIIAALGFRIYYYKKINDTLHCFIYSVQSMYPSYGASLFVAVMCFITGGASVITLPFNFTLATLCSAAATICFGIIIIQYRSLIYRLRCEYEASRK